MAEAKAGDTVKVHYKGTLDDGSVFDSSEGGEPIEFTLGQNRVIPGFEKAVEGMSEGDTKSATIPAADAYGEHQSDRMAEVPRSELPDDLEPQVGQRLQVKGQDGESFVVTIADVGEEQVTLDANHPLAGQDLTFEIQLVEIA
jgi:peptidylprolyl isomerase